MSEQVKRYSVDCPLAYPPLDGEREVVLAADYDALHAELEAARGLLERVTRNVPQLFGHPGLLSEIGDFLAAIPAPEVPDHIEHNLAMVEQGERQEAVASDALRKRFSEIEDEVARGEHNAMSCFTAMRTAALYTSQPGQDVRGLVETLEQIIRKADDRTAMTDADYRTLSSVVAEEALAAHRQAQQDSSN